MSVKHLAVVCVSLIALALFLPMNASAAVNGIRTGDFWEYKGVLVGEIGATGNVTVKMAVAGSATDVIGGRSQSVLRLNLSGGGDVKAEVPGLGNATGTLKIRGDIDRLESNFSIAHSSTILDFTFTVPPFGLQVPLTVGVIASLSQPLDDYIGDDSLSVGTQTTSRTTASVDSWTYSTLLGGNSTNESTEIEQLTLLVTRANVSITVPAGTFDCTEVRVTGMSGTNTTPSGYWYYSQKVGNYVQMKNANASPAAFLGNLNLTDYSYKKSNAFSLSSPVVLAFMGAIIVVAAIAVIVIVLSRSRRGRKSGPSVTDAGRTPPQMGGPPPMPPEPPVPPSSE